jgi:hypothetical protein
MVSCYAFRKYPEGCSKTQFQSIAGHLQCLWNVGHLPGSSFCRRPKLAEQEDLASEGRSYVTESTGPGSRDQCNYMHVVDVTVPSKWGLYR